MKNYRTIPIWENKNRLDKLKKWRELVEEYYDNLSPPPIGTDPMENEIAKEARRHLNLSMRRTKEILASADITPLYRYYANTGHVSEFDAIDNIYRFIQFNRTKADALDFIDIASGVFENDQTNAWIRTFNPFYWLFQAVNYIASVPFWILGQIGFNQTRIESSRIGIVMKFLFKSIAIVASILTILSFLGYGIER